MNKINKSMPLNQPSASIVVPLVEATQETLCGGKATGLAKAMGLGLPVPNGFVITNRAFEAFLEQDSLGARITKLVDLLSIKDFKAVRTASTTISKWVKATRLPHGIVDTLTSELGFDMSGLPLIVRSSAVGEDSSEASYAGQLDSFLNIQTLENLESAIKECWASYWSERVLQYQLSTGKQLKGMGVLIQHQVNSKLAGVLFSQPPIKKNNSKDQYMLGEYCYGQGISLVSGQINPGRFRILKEDLTFQKICDPEQSHQAEASVDQSSSWIIPLANAALKLENFHQHPQDIEWAVDHSDNLFIVQSRPVVVHTDADSSSNMITWSNANVRENFPDPITPLLYSVASTGYSNYFRNLGLAFGISKKRIRDMDGPLRNIVGVHGARIYYNLSSIHSVIRMAPFGEQLVQYFNSFVGATETPRPHHGDRQFKDTYQNRAKQFLEVIHIIAKTSWSFIFLERGVVRFEDRINRFADKTNPATVKSLSTIELRDLIRSFMDIRLHHWTDAGLADAASMISYGILNTLLRNTFPNENQSSLPNSLLKGVTGLVSSEPVFELWDLSRLILKDEGLYELFSSQPSDMILKTLQRQGSSGNSSEFSTAFDDYLDKWGFRRSGELMLTIPTFQEKPAGLIDILKTYLKVEGESPAEALEKQKTIRQQQSLETLRQIDSIRRFGPIQRVARKLLVKKFLKWTQSAISLRERARFKQALLYTRLRYLALSIGDRFKGNKFLEQSDDIFFLTCQEIDELASSCAMFSHSIRDLISLRREHHKRLSTMNLPDSFAMEEGIYLDEGMYVGNTDNPSDLSDDILEGTTACGGKIQGRATVLHDISEADQLGAGDILITTQTDPGWAHVFFLIKGLVIERGGMLSHGAILAREFGIPAIVGVQNVTKRIPQYSTVLLDADQGRVHVLD